MLNPEQTLAVDHVDGTCLVLACPGSGKTRALTSRVVSLIRNQKIEPKNILCLTFTNKAAREMKERIGAELGEEISSQVWISTFHFLCISILRKHASKVDLTSSFSIYDDQDQKELLNKIARMRECEIKPQMIYHLCKVINDYREQLEPASYLEDSLYDITNANGDDPRWKIKVAKEYLELIDEFNAVDFSGILYKTHKLLTEHNDVALQLVNRFKYIMVDEGQDTNKIQYEIVKKIAAHQNLFVVGDPNQSVYRFRGARPENLDLIKEHFSNVKEITLFRNYRSTAQILAVAERLIRNNPEGVNVNLTAHRGNGNQVELRRHSNPQYEAMEVANKLLNMKHSGLPWKDAAVLYRTNSQSQFLEMELRKAQIPYKVYGGFSFFDRKEIKTSISYLEFLSNPNDTISFARAISDPARDVGKTTIGKIERLCQIHKTSILNACSMIEKIPKVSAASKESLANFVATTKKYQKQLADGVSCHEVAIGYLKDTGYYEHINSESKKDDTSKRRVDNVDQFLVGVADFSSQKPSATLAEYLHTIQLMNDMTEEEADDSVSLMTIHAAKGLEFPVVFLVGCEEGLIPHKFSQGEKDIEEERRLLFVGVTRAQNHLFISHCRKRSNIYGKSGVVTSAKPSRFLSEMFPELIDES